jgi:hypothetical protein
MPDAEPSPRALDEKALLQLHKQSDPKQRPKQIAVLVRAQADCFDELDKLTTGVPAVMLQRAVMFGKERLESGDRNQQVSAWFAILDHDMTK